MTPFDRLAAVACPLPFSGIDTDQLIPARFMKRSRADGYGGYLLYDRRFDGNGQPRTDFPLNRPEHKDARILVARRNFGGGSSREAAVYALTDFGIRCVIAPSFGDIFFGNAVNNGLLPARVSDDECEIILALLEENAGELTVDLSTQVISAHNLEFAFAIEPIWRTKLLNGWDDLDLTQSYATAIAEFSARDRLRRPWAEPRKWDALAPGGSLEPAESGRPLCG